MSGKIFWLIAFFAALYVFALGRAALDPKDEGRYAEIPREMLATHDFVTPRLDGVNYFEKPPLIYWIEAGSQKLLGRSEWAVRAPVAGFALLGVLMTYGAARRLWGEGAGIGAAAALGVSAFYCAYSHILSLDLAVAVLIAGTLYCFILGIREPAGPKRRAWFYGLYVCSALATLTKGPIGFLLTGAVMFFWLLLCRQWKRLLPLYLPTGIVLFLLVAAPWHLLAAHRNPSWAHFYFIHENWERFTTTEHGRKGPFYYFIPEIFPGTFPWFGFIGAACAWALRGGWKRRTEPQNAERWYFLIWAALIFLFFSKSQSKLPGYVLPCFLPLGVMYGAWFAEVWEDGENALRRTKAGMLWFTGFCFVLAAAAVVAVSLPGTFKIDAWQAAGLRKYAFALAAALCAGAISVIRSRRRGDVRAALISMGITGAMLLGVVELASPFLFKPGTKALALVVPPDARVYSYREFFHDFLYYSQRQVDIVDYVGELEPENDPSPAAAAHFVNDADFLQAWAEPRNTYAVVRRQDSAALLGELKEKGLRYRLIGETAAHYLVSNQ